MVKRKVGKVKHHIRCKFQREIYIEGVGKDKVSLRLSAHPQPGIIIEIIQRLANPLELMNIFIFPKPAREERKSRVLMRVSIHQVWQAVPVGLRCECVIPRKYDG